MKQPIELQLSEFLGNIFEKLGLPTELGTVTISDRPDLADYQCNGALAGAKQSGKKPRDLATEILAEIGNAEFGDFSIAGPGFINVKLSNPTLESRLEVLSHDERRGCEIFANGVVVMDFGGYNIAKALHFGHIRSTLQGDALQRLMRFAGNAVISDVHLGDWGTQMGQLIEAVRKEQPDLPYFDPDYSGDYPEEPPFSLADLNRLYPAASKLCKDEPAEAEKARLATAELQAGRRGYFALWKHFVGVSLPELKNDIAPFDVSFDYWLGESDAQPLIPDMVQSMIDKGYAEQSKGAYIVPVADIIGRDVVPLMLQKSDGAATYATTDLATIVDRVARFHPDTIIYLTDDRQKEHFQQVFAAARKTGLAPEKTALEHLWFGTINGPDGKPFKTRSGDTVKLRDVTNMVIQAAHKRLTESGRNTSGEDIERTALKVGMAAIRFAELSNERAKNYVLDLDALSSPEGRTGPYLLYTAVRIKAILNQADQKGLSKGSFKVVQKEDRDLAVKLLAFRRTVLLAYEKREIHHLCQFAFELAQTFSSFYNKCHIMREENPETQAAWLKLSELCLAELSLVLKLIGIKIPEQM